MIKKINKLKIIISFGIIIFSVFGCVVKQEIYFKKDFSGNYKYTFDFKEYANMMKETEDSDSISMEIKTEDFAEYLEYIKSILKNINGINNIKIFNDADHGMVYYSFDFNDVPSLNEALKQTSGIILNEKVVDYPPYFIQNKKKLTYIRPPVPIETEEEDSVDFGYMNDIFKWELSLQFETEVKKYDIQKDTSVIVTENNHKFTEFTNIYSAYEKHVNWTFKTK